MLTITVLDYDEGADVFNCRVTDDVSGETFDAPIGAFLVPYIAYEVYDMDDDGAPPFGLVGKTFTMLTPLLNEGPADAVDRFRAGKQEQDADTLMRESGLLRWLGEILPDEAYVQAVPRLRAVVAAAATQARQEETTDAAKLERAAIVDQITQLAAKSDMPNTWHEGVQWALRIIKATQPSTGTANASY